MLSVSGQKSTVSNREVSHAHRRHPPGHIPTTLANGPPRTHSFWLAHNGKQVRDRVSGRVGRFAVVIRTNAYIRLPGGTEFQARCGDLEVVTECVNEPATH